MTQIMLVDGSLFDPDYNFGRGVRGPSYPVPETEEHVWCADVTLLKPGKNIILYTISLGTGTLAQELAMWQYSGSRVYELLTADRLSELLANGAVDARDTQEELDRYCVCGRIHPLPKLEICWLSEPLERPIRTGRRPVSTLPDHFEADDSGRTPFGGRV